MKVGISGCLGFWNCRYDGKGYNIDLKQAKSFLKNELKTDNVKFLPVCPEQLGELTTPRIPSEIVGGTGADVLDGKAKVMSKDGKDVTINFIRGAMEVLDYCKKAGIKAFLMKEKSPSCGVETIYTGEFNGNLKPGNGVTTALLLRNNIKVFSDTMLSAVQKLVKS